MARVGSEEGRERGIAREGSEEGAVVLTEGKVGDGWRVEKDQKEG